MAKAGKVLYVYKCMECGHRGEEHFDDDLHDGEMVKCPVCGASVLLEWDGGVTFDTPKSIADEAIAHTRRRK